jgi:hypothetical protein
MPEPQRDPHIAIETGEKLLPAAAEVPACGLAIAQFANPFRHRSTNRMQRSSAKHQVFELRSAAFIQGANFAVNDGSHIRQRIGD